MSGPYLHVGMWDHGRDGAALAEAARVHLMLSGAEVTGGPERRRVSGAGALTGGDRPARLETMPSATGGLAQLAVDLDTVDGGPADALVAVVRAALDVVTGVRPLLATLAVEDPPDALPDPDWASASVLLAAGWVDRERLSAVRRLRFAKLLEAGVAREHRDGLLWGHDALLGEGGGSGTTPTWVLAAAAYEAWTGRAAEPVATTPEDVPGPELSAPQVWWWRQGEDAALTLERVTAALGAGAWVDPASPPGWQAVVAALPPGDVTAALQVLRRTVAAVRPSWCAVRPTGGLAVPGMDPDVPATGVLAHPWVDATWAASAMPELEAVFAGASREELAGGVLWVTDPRLAELPDPAPWTDPGERWQRLVRAADILARAARRV